MAWFLRKSFRLGPLRLNFSKSGLGGSLGVKGLHVGLDAKGRRYLADGAAVGSTSASTSSRGAARSRPCALIVAPWRGLRAVGGGGRFGYVVAILGALAVVVTLAR